VHNEPFGAPFCDGQGGKECDDLDDDFEDVYAGLGGDRLWGNDSNNDLRTHRGNDWAWAFDGCDRFRAGADNDYFDAGAGDDPCPGQSIVMETGNDTVLGGPGDDVLDAGPNTDVADGGDGFDKCLGAETRISCEQ